MSFSLRKPLAALVAVLAPLALAGCSDSSTNPSESGTAFVRIAHLSPDAPAVDVRFNGAYLVQDAPFQAVTGYLPVPAGEARIQVSPAGATQPVVIDSTLTLSPNTSYTVAATGLLSANDLRPIVLVDDRTTSGSQAKVRFVHASPDAPAVDVAVTGGPVIFGDVAFRENSDPAGVPGGTYNLEVRVAGTTAVALQLPGVGLASNTNYTVFAIGQLSNGSLAALPVVDAP